MGTAASAQPAKQPYPIRVAVLDFGSESTALHVAGALREQLSTVKGFTVVDPDAAKAAAAGMGYAGSLNLAVEEARDLGSAIGCDFFFVGDAQTLRRLPSSEAPYFESFASIFLVSARTGRLVMWDRPAVRGDSAERAEQTLLAQFKNASTIKRYTSAIEANVSREAAERAERVEKSMPVIEIMSEESSDGAGNTRPPRPYRRLKPDYPQTAAEAQVEAVVDVLVDVDEHGEVAGVKIVRWAGYGLDESVISTVKQLHFFPAMRDERAIPMRVLLRYNFRKPPPQ